MRRQVDNGVPLVPFISPKTRRTSAGIRHPLRKPHSHLSERFNSRRKMGISDALPFGSPLGSPRVPPDPHPSGSQLSCHLDPSPVPALDLLTLLTSSRRMSRSNAVEPRSGPQDIEFAQSARRASQNERIGCLMRASQYDHRTSRRSSASRWPDLPSSRRSGHGLDTGWTQTGQIRTIIVQTGQIRPSSALKRAPNDQIRPVGKHQLANTVAGYAQFMMQIGRKAGNPRFRHEKGIHGNP